MGGYLWICLCLGLRLQLYLPQGLRLGPFPAAAPAMGAGNVPATVPGSAVVLSALERSGSAPASAALTAAEPDAAEPGAATVSGLGLLVARAADLESVSASVLSSGSEAGPLLVAAL